MESSFITSVLLPAALFVIMLGMGLSLVLADFKRVVLYPKAVLIALVNQLVLLPLIGFGLTIVFGLQTELAVGLMLLAACPGGATSNLISHLAKGDTALSITLTALSSLITIFTIPLIVNLSLLYFMERGQYIQLDVPATILQIIGITLVPVGIGMLVRSRNRAFAHRMDRPVKLASVIFFFVIVAGAVIKERAQLLEYLQLIGLSTASLNLLTMALGYFSGRLFRLSKAQCITISVESGIQNGTLGIIVATTFLHSSSMAIPPAIYSLLMFVSGLGFAYLVNRKKQAGVSLG
ncbi:bile acid:sodium symporter family protein [Cesiribacter andamanensis]|uniref:Bile acid transporter n=1 Tax=Cesiribacter andamanensis AMV16 TaxID=1279009 RepID=M7N7L5_9BACT|nr:bile acid:sodium symporter family protein [Cesiribacter andamanensis]EMR03237.1 bile acid transporter [Cesiribacter andamanensis AMV16]